MEGKEVQQQEVEKLSPKILEALKKLFGLSAEEPMEIETCPISGIGENFYALVLRVNLKSKVPAGKPCRCILKIAPTNFARRTQMRVRNYYEREVYMYNVIFPAYRTLSEGSSIQPNLMANMLDYSLDDGKEFIIFEDLTELNYIVGRRLQLPNITVASKALCAIAQFHALSFAFQAKEPDNFKTLTSQLQPDNLFTTNIDPITIEFGKSYIRRAINLIQSNVIADDEEMSKHLELLHNVEHNFKEICLRCVDGRSCAPYSVICHGDFWSNNILNRYDENNCLVSTKLVDFQMSRYASPVLDLVHYLFVSIGSDLRGPNFQHFIYDVYYASLGQQLKLFDLDVQSIFPLEIFQHHLRNYAIYGLCMAAFSLPIFVADATELLDLDKVAEAVEDIGKSTTETTTQHKNIAGQDNDLNQSRLKLIEQDFNLLTERTAPLFKSRIAGVVADLVKHIYKNDLTIITKNVK